MVERRPAGTPERAVPFLAAWLGLALAASSPAAAEKLAIATAVRPDAGEEITLERIMSDPDWIGNRPTDPYWADDGSTVYFSQKRDGERLTDLVRIELATAERAVVADEDLGAADVAGGRLSRDRRRKVYSRHGDLYVKDLEDGTLTQLTRSAAAETAPFFMADGASIGFERDGQVFVRDLATGLERQAADLRLEKEPETKEEDDGFLATEQRRLFDVLRRQETDREARREHDRREQGADPTRAPLPFYLGDDLEILQRALSPAGDALLLVVADKKRELGRRDRMPAWVTESGYVDFEEVRPKVGTGQGAGERLLLLDLTSHEQHELDLSVLPGIAEDPLAELRRQTEAAKREKSEEGDGGEAPGDEGTGESADAGETKDAGETMDAGEKEKKPSPRAVRFDLPPAWSPDGSQLVVQAHSVDNKDRWLALVDLAGTALRPIHRLSHEAWINWYFNEFGWLADGRRLWFLSEESGTSQLYLYSAGDGDGDGDVRRLSGGDGVVSDVVLGPREELFYYTANPDHPGIYETYRVAIDSGLVEQLTRFGGRSSSALSPDGEQLLVTHSTTTRPPELHVQPARPGAAARRITRTAAEAFTSLPWIEPEIVAIESSHHGGPIYSRYYQPPGEAGDERPEEGRPAVVFVHGAGYLQNAHHGWSGYFREFMFHTFLARRGYAVLDMDYRASAGYGADWRTAIYRQMGTPELEDLADGVAWLVAEHGVDPRRVGVYGGSYGGFLTMMALFTRPDLFACGAALRPVTDWAHYNHPYTSNILNTPEVDPEAYRRSSPIEHATGLEKPLLICAPMQDDNVLFSDTVRLAQRLIELEKEDWEVAIYPVEPHGFRQPSSWLDEYRRIFKLFETHLAP